MADTTVFLEAKKPKLPDPDHMVPVYHWTKQFVWVFLKVAGQPPLMVKLPHKLIRKNYKDKLAWPEEKWDLLGKIDPSTYAGPKHVYPLSWQPEHGKVTAPPDPGEHHTKAVKKPPASAEQPELYAVDELPPDAPAHWHPEGPPEEDGSQFGYWLDYEAFMDPTGSYIYRDPEEDPKQTVLWGKKPGETAAQTVASDPGAKAVADQKKAKPSPPPSPKPTPKAPKLGDYKLPSEFNVLEVEAPKPKSLWARGEWGANKYAADLYYYPGNPKIEIPYNIGSTPKGTVLWSHIVGVTTPGEILSKPHVPPGGWKKDELPPDWKLGTFVDKHGTWTVISDTGQHYYLLPNGEFASYDSFTGKYQPIKYEGGEWEVNHDASPVDPKTTLKQSQGEGGVTPVIDVPKGWTVQGPKHFTTADGTKVMWDAKQEKFVYADEPWKTYITTEKGYSFTGEKDPPTWIPKGWKHVGDDPNGFPQIQNPAKPAILLSLLDVDANIFGRWSPGGQYYSIFKRQDDKFKNLGMKKSLIQVKAKPWNNQEGILALGFAIAKGAVNNALDDGIPVDWVPSGEDSNGLAQFQPPEWKSEGHKISILEDGSLGLQMVNAPDTYALWVTDELGSLHSTGKQVTFHKEPEVAPKTTGAGVDLPSGWEHWDAVDPNGLDLIHSKHLDIELSVLPKKVGKSKVKFGYWTGVEYQLGQPVTVGLVAWAQEFVSLNDLGMKPAPSSVGDTSVFPDGFVNDTNAEVEGIDWTALAHAFAQNSFSAAVKVVKDAGASGQKAYAIAHAARFWYLKKNPQPYELPVKTTGGWEKIPLWVSMSEVVALLLETKKIAAIKYVRELTGWNLANTIKWVEYVDQKLKYPEEGLTQVASFADLQAKFSKSPDYEPGGVDANGFDRWISKTSGQFVTPIPTGYVARWSIKKKLYVALEQDDEKDQAGWWYPMQPEKTFTLEEVLAAKSGGSVEQQPEGGTELPPGWSLVAEKDPNGLTQISHPKHAPTVPRSILPAMSPEFYGRWLKSQKKYRLYKISPNTGALISIKPKQYATVGEVKAAPSAVTQAKTTAQFDLSTWAGGEAKEAGYDENGAYQVGSLVKGSPEYLAAPVGVDPPVIAKWMPAPKHYVLFTKADGYWHTDKPKEASIEEVLKAQKQIGLNPKGEPFVAQPPVKIPSTPKATKAAELPSSETLAALANKLPDPDQLTVLTASEQPSLGGAGQKWVFKDPSGSKWLFKPAWPKYGTEAEPHRAYAQEVNAVVANSIRDHIPLKTVRLAVPGASGKQVGTLQPFIEGASSLSGVSPESLEPSELHDVITDHVIDWVTSQHDSHAGNLMRLPDGRVVSIDKEQGFKYFEKFGAPGFPDEVLSTEFHPNSKYGEQEPFYNKCWRAFAEGKVDFDPMVLKGAFLKLQGLHFSELEPSLRQYANTSPGLSGKDAYTKEEFLAAVNSRKNTAKRDFEKFIEGAYKQRTGKEGEFTFRDGWVEKGEKKYKTVVHDLNEISSLAPGDKSSFNVTLGGSEISVAIRNYSKEQGAEKDDPELIVFKVPSGVGLEKLNKVLEFFKVEAIGDPVQGSANLMVFVRRADLKKVGKVEQKLEVTNKNTILPHSGAAEYLPRTDLFSPADPNFELLDSKSPGKLGVAGKRVFFDTDWVTGQTATYKKVKEHDTVFTEVIFRLNRLKMSSIASIGGAEASLDAKAGTYSSAHDALDKTGGQTIGSSKAFLKGKSVFVNADSLFISTSKYYASKGLIVAKIKGSNITGSLKALLTKSLGEELADQIVKPVTPEHRELLAARRLLSAYAPKKHDKLAASGGYAGLAEAIESEGLKTRLGQVREVDGVEGQLTHAIPGRWKENRSPSGKPILKFCYHGTGNPEAVPAMLTFGLAGGVMRATAVGTTKTGACNETDWLSGGADTTGLRVVTENTLSNSFANIGGVGAAAHIQLVIAPDVCDRLDAVLHASDNYQVTHGDSKYGKTWQNRVELTEKIKKLNDNHGMSGHEMILMRGLHQKKIIRVVCSNESYRASVLAACYSEDVKEHNGVPIEDFVVVVSGMKLKSVYDKYVAPAGY